MKLGRKMVAGLFGLLILAGLVWVRFADPYPVRAVRDIGFDFYQQLAPREGGGFPIRIIDIDEPSLAAIGQWPWPRDRLATLTRRLAELGAAVVAFDVLFTEPDRTSPRRVLANSGALTAMSAADIAALADHDAEFAEALASSPSVLAFSVSPNAATEPDAPKTGVVVRGTDPTGAVFQMRGAVMPLAELAEAALGLGAINLAPSDTVDVVRRVPLVWSNGERLFPSFSIEALRVALGLSALIVDGEIADSNAAGFMRGVSLGELKAPTTAEGLMWLYYSRYDPTQTIPAWALLGEDYRSLTPGIAGHIVLVGTSAEGLFDIKATPLGENVPGVSIHAQVIEQMLAQNFLDRPTGVEAAEYLAMIVVGLAVIVAILRSGPLVTLGIGGALGAAALGVGWWAFRSQGVLVDLTFPLGGGLIVYGAMIFFRFTITDADRRQIRRAFGHYVAPAVLSQIEKSDKLTLGGEERDLSIMFIDVRNFTTISESMEPRALVTMLNRMFEALGAEITGSLGTIDKFIGDAIMAFWNAPLDVERHPLKACEAALRARAALDKINGQDGFGLKASGHPIEVLRIGIGIATGEALVGNMGLETRFDYSCVGDVVNVASRVEGACKALGYDIAVVEETQRGAAELAFLYAGSMALKGKADREPVFVLVGDAGMAVSDAFRQLSEWHDRLVDSLRAGEMDDDAYDRCLEIADNLDPHLAVFYQLIAGRAADFVATQAEASAEA